MQTKTQSFIEALTGTFIGFLIATVANWLVLPLYGFEVSITASVEIAVIFTFISIARSYLVRRLFNAIHRVRT